MTVNWQVFKTLPHSRMEGSQRGRAQCPVCLARTALSVTVDGSQSLWHCHAGCDQKDVHKELVDKGILHMEQREQKPPNTFFKTLLADGTPYSEHAPKSISSYFRKRGLKNSHEALMACGAKFKRYPEHNAFRLYYPIRSYYGEVTGCQQVTININQMKCVDRKCFGAMKGKAIYLNDKAMADTALIGEGVESVLAFSQIHDHNEAMWVSGICANGVSGWIPPAHVKNIMVAADFDGAGLSAAEKLQRSVSDRCQVAIMLPKAHKWDWNDELLQGSQRAYFKC